MTISKRPVVAFRDQNQLRRDRETINGLLDHSLDDYRKRTTAEVLAGVTPVNYAYPPGDVRRYGAKGDGVTDDTAAIQRAINAVGVAGEVFFPIGTFRCEGSLTGLNFQTWIGECYELGAGGTQSSLYCTLANGTFVTAGANPRFESLRFLGVVTYDTDDGSVADSTAIAIKLTDGGVTFRDCVFQNQFFCIETASTGVFYFRWNGGEVNRCGVFLNMTGADCFDVEISGGHAFRFCSTVISSNDTPKRFVHNLKVIGGSFEQWQALFNYVASAEMFGVYFESDIVGGFGFNSNNAFTNVVAISLHGCFLFLNNLNTFVNYGGLTGGTFASFGNTICGSANPNAQNQYYFLPMDSGGSVSMVGDKLDDRGNGSGFFGSYISNTALVRNQLVVWPYEHANGGQTWVPGSMPTPVTATTAELTDITNAINTTNKFVYKLVMNTTSNKLVASQGSSVASTWISVDGATTHTPV